MTKVKVIQRDCSEADFDKSKISTAILKAMKNGSGIVNQRLQKILQTKLKKSVRIKTK